MIFCPLKGCWSSLLHLLRCIALFWATLFQLCGSWRYGFSYSTWLSFGAGNYNKKAKVLVYIFKTWFGAEKQNQTTWSSDFLHYCSGISGIVGTHEFLYSWRWKKNKIKKNSTYSLFMIAKFCDNSYISRHFLPWSPDLKWTFPQNQSILDG